MAWWDRLNQMRWPAHLLRALDRFTSRLGTQFAAGVAYYSILALVPGVMLAFSGLGLTLTVIQPHTIPDLEAWIESNITIADPAVQSQVGEVLDMIVETVNRALGDWAAIGVIGLLISLWLGATWVSTLKRAIRVQLREETGYPRRRRAWVVDMLVNVGVFLVMLMAVAIIFLLLPATSLVGEDIRSALHLPNWFWSMVLSLLITLGVGSALFWMLFRIFSPSHIRRRVLWYGSLLGASGLIVLQWVATLAIRLLSHNLTAILFGPLIVVMLFLNIFATWVLFVAAWIGTFDPPAAPAKKQEPDLAAVAEEFNHEAADATSGKPVGLVSGLLRLGVLGVSAAVLRRMLRK
ncbi:MAG: YihY/virulence factor BrkB family protein [Propionibacteriaceae bacterium]|jgi:membrane protein|nr:YihY/virulence factor BrkB family protein [Propionibacteriaceae bacterium]